MDTRAAPVVPKNPSYLSADMALQIASWTWCALLALPFVLFLIVIWRLMDSESPPAANQGQEWFIAGMIYMMIGPPLAFFIRSRLFRGYWSGRIIPPKNYLIGMITLWMSLEFGGLFALVGCLISGVLLPNLMTALLAFMFFLPLSPNGHSMTRPLVNEHDPGDYEDPR